MAGRLAGPTNVPTSVLTDDSAPPNSTSKYGVKREWLWYVKRGPIVKLVAVVSQLAWLIVPLVTEPMSTVAPIHLLKLYVNWALPPFVFKSGTYPEFGYNRVKL